MQKNKRQIVARIYGRTNNGEEALCCPSLCNASSQRKGEKEKVNARRVGIDAKWEKMEEEEEKARTEH